MAQNQANEPGRALTAWIILGGLIAIGITMVVVFFDGVAHQLELVAVGLYGAAVGVLLWERLLRLTQPN